MIHLVYLIQAPDIKVSSYNCRGLPKNSVQLHTRPDIVHLFENSDIIALQETWFAKQELALCNGLHDNFLAVSVASLDYGTQILQGRPYGGVSVFYHKRLAQYVKPLYFKDCDWCVGINVTINDVCFTIIAIYLPYECNDHEDEYIEQVCMLESYIATLEHGTFAIISTKASSLHCTITFIVWIACSCFASACLICHALIVMNLVLRVL